MLALRLRSLSDPSLQFTFEIVNMVQKYQSPVRVYKYPFEIVMAAYEKRFPTCKMIPVFLGSDIIKEYLSEDDAIEDRTRRCRLAVDAPYILKKIVGVDHVIFIQRNLLNRKNRTLHIYAHNESFASRIVINEHCAYSVHADNPNWTCFEQDAQLDIKSFFGFENMVEKICIKQYQSNIKKGKEVIQYYIDELISEGVEHIPPWRDPNVPDADTPEVPVEKARASSSTQEGAGSLLTPAAATRSRSESASSHSSLELGATAATIFAPTGSPCKDSKLETDYIQRYLGKLTLYQESKLVQLRTWLQETHKEKIPKDGVILRFLKARDFNIEKAREMLCHSLAWRKRHGIDNLLSTYKAPQVISDYYSGGWHFNDRDGRPLYILRLGQMDVKGLIRSAGEDGVLRHVLAVNEEGLRRAEEATRVRGHPITNCTCIVDLEGLSMRHVWRPGIKVLLRIIEVTEANYPETMGRLLIVRAPRVFPVLWTLVSPFIDENTRNKFLIYGGKDYLGTGGLVDYVSEELLPDFLGGPCFCDVPEGGLVPKNLYIHADDMERERVAREKSPEEPLGPSESLYHNAFVEKGYPHEVLVQVPQRGCVITWDFDILKGDVTFTVFRTRRSLTADPHEHHISGAVGGIGSTQFIDKHMQVGIDLSIVEPPLVCRDGDSIQGSHVVGQSGSYILQWKYFDSAKSSFEILSHKSKVMYYTELLPSEQFRGSMTSLQSCTSGFSQLSGTTSQSSSGINSSSLSCPSR